MILHNRRLMFKTSSISYLFFVFSLMIINAHNLHGATIMVPPPPASIQPYIDSASPGDTVQLSSGTYVEEILITTDITLAGNGVDVSIIQCPTLTGPLSNSFTFIPNGGTYHPFVMVQNANVTIQDLTIDGNSQPSNFLSYRFDGIGYHNASGTIQNVHATNVQDDSPGGPTQHGFAIAGAIDDGNPHTINVLNCTVDNFQKAGIDMRGATLTAILDSNTVTGETPSSTANANGIVIQFGAQATITNNTVNNLLSTVSGNDAVSILLSGAGSNSTISGNTANNSDIGIYSASAGDNLIISNNTANNNTDVGIYVQDTDGSTTIENNIISDNVNYNLYVYNSATNNPFQLASNQFIGSQIGFGVQGNVSTGPVVTMNSDSFTGSIQYYIQEITAPNDIWPSTATVSFDGLVSGHITFAEYTAIRTKIVDQQSPVFDPTLGLVLDYIVPSAPEVTGVSPNSGISAGGNTVTITGTNFLSSDTEVFFGSTQASNVVVVLDSTLTATVPPGTGTVDVTVVTPFGTSIINTDDTYTYTVLPPTNFIGELLEDCCDDGVSFESTWDASESPNIIFYRIYRNGVAIKTVPGQGPFAFITRCQPVELIDTFSITAIDSFGVASAAVPIEF